MAKQTIKLKKYVDIIEQYIAEGTITPGHLIELTSSNTVQAHSTSAGNVLPMFALEDELQGNDIDDDYSADDPVQVWVAVRGEIVNCLLANGQDASIGDFLESNGDGTLKVYGADSTGIYYPNQIVGQAVDAVDMSGSTLEDPDGRIQVRII